MKFILSAVAVIVLSVVLFINSVTAVVASVLGGGVEPEPVSSASPVAYTPSTSAFGQIVRVQGIDIDSSIAANLDQLLTDARNDGIVLSGWGNRSHQRQHELRKINGCPNDGSWTHTPNEDPSKWASASRCRVPTARPGFSNHESGLAVDFTYQGSTIKSRASPAFKWLARNAARYGFKNLPTEPWHWSTDGR